MTEAANPQIDPHDLINVKDVSITLRNDKGTNAKLKKITIKDFTKKGDNYGCIVTSVNVSYIENGLDKETSYVAKLNPRRSAGFDKSKLMFKKEIGFYTEILPLLNEELKGVNEPALRIPKCFHCVTEELLEVIYLEDLRTLGFKMCDRRKGMNKDQTDLIVIELARFHAASSLLMDRGEYQGCDMVEKFPVLHECYDSLMDECDPVNMNTFLVGFINLDVKIAEKLGGYEEVKQFLLERAKDGRSLLLEQLKCKDQFKVICHGDCWNNNFVFR